MSQAVLVEVSSISWGSYRVLEAGHLERQNLDLGLSLRLLVGQFLLLHLGSLQFPTPVLHLSLHRFQMAAVGGASYLHLVG
jgi:hypothetical protein